MPTLAARSSFIWRKSLPDDCVAAAARDKREATVVLKCDFCATHDDA
jgi:hypothetical protein